MTHEICYAISMISTSVYYVDGDLINQDDVFDLQELAYKNDCGGVAGANYAPS